MKTWGKLLAWMRGINWISENISKSVLDHTVTIDKESMANRRKTQDIERGEYLYYIVDEDTNVRKMENGQPVIYLTPGVAEFACVGDYEVVISVAAYNCLYGRFMTNPHPLYHIHIEDTNID